MSTTEPQYGNEGVASLIGRYIGGAAACWLIIVAVFCFAILAWNLAVSIVGGPHV